MSSALCKCGTVRDKQISGPNSNFPDRPYYKCQSCGVFDWADQTTPRKIFSTVVGPNCNCGKATVQRAVKKTESPNRGKKFWGCAAWPRGCDFFEFCDDNHKQDFQASPRKLFASSPDRNKRKPTPGFASYLSDWKRVQIIEKLLAVDPQKLKAETGGLYDKLEVVGTWKIGNPARMEKYQAAKRRIKSISSSPKVSGYNFPGSLEDSMNELGTDSLDKKAGEVFLLHGTKPENLYGILFEGLDPEMAANGNFGRGVYFAENAAKTNQYASVDERWQKEGSLGELHEKIYKGQKHPGNVRYVLICRVVLGRHVETKDGKTTINEKNGDKTQKKNQSTFTDHHRKALASLKDGTTPSSLIGIPGERTRDFREFVVFHADQVFVEYLVAYKRTRSLCDCGVECLERTVTKQTENRGSKIHLCGSINEGDKRCKFIQMLPLCNCGESASVKTSQSAKNPNRKFYGCGSRPYRGNKCSFFQWQDETGSSYAPAASPNKKPRTL